MKQEDFLEGSDNRKHVQGAAIAIWVLTALFTFFVCCQWNNIALGAAIVEASSDFVTSNTRVALIPVIMYIICIPISAWWTMSAVYLMSIGKPYQEENSFIASIEY